MKKSFLLISFMMGFIFSSYSQNTSSPYTRYGYGSLVDAGSGLSKSMGGLSFGLRPKGFINSGNPASYTAIDSMTFRFELGAEAKLSTYSDKNANQTTFDANLSYMALQFPITRWLGVSAGILPYSFVGYDFYQTDVQPSSMTNGSLNSQYDYEGKGGLTQAYFGLGVSPFRNFSVGVNVEYNFGDIEHTSDVSFTTSAFRSMCQSKKISVSDFNWLAGVQYEFDLDDQKHMTVGLVYEPKAEMNANATQQIYVSGVDTVNIVLVWRVDSRNAFKSDWTINVRTGRMLSISVKNLSQTETESQREQSFCRIRTPNVIWSASIIAWVPTTPTRISRWVETS